MVRTLMAPRFPDGDGDGDGDLDGDFGGDGGDAVASFISCLKMPNVWSELIFSFPLQFMNSSW